MKFFAEKIYTLTDLPSLKKQMRSFAVDLHPDHGGKDEDFISMMNEYDFICEELSVNRKYEATDTPEKPPTEKPSEPRNKQEKPPESKQEKQTYDMYSQHSNRLYADIRPEVLNNPWGAIAIWYIMFLVSISIWFLGWRYHLVSLFCVLGSMWYLYIKGKDAYGHWLTFFLLLNAIAILGTDDYSESNLIANFIVILCIMPIFWLYSIYIRSEG